MEPRLGRVETALAVGFVLRLLWVLAVPMVLFSDPAAYSEMARNLLDHGVYGFEPDAPNSTWPPGTSAFYAVLFALPGPDVVAVKTANVILSVLNIWLTWAIAGRLFGPRAALFAAWAMALWPQMIFFTTLTASEPLFLTLLLAGILAWEKGRDAKTRSWLTYAALAGLLIALATYVRSVALLVPLTLVIGEIGRQGDRLWRVVARLCLAAAVMAATIAPWSLRNLNQFDTLVVMSSNFGTNLYIGNGPGSTGRFGTVTFPDDLPDGTYIERSDALGEIAKEIIRDDPGAFLARSASKLVIIHDRETIGVAWNQQALRPLVGDGGIAALKGAATLYWWGILAAGLAGIVWQLWRGIGWRILFSTPMALWGYFATIHAVILAGDRFHIPQAPFVAILGAAALAGWLGVRHGNPTYNENYAK